jgi:hypothetical protein
MPAIVTDSQGGAVLAVVLGLLPLSPKADGTENASCWSSLIPGGRSIYAEGGS